MLKLKWHKTIRRLTICLNLTFDTICIEITGMKRPMSRAVGTIVEGISIDIGETGAIGCFETHLVVFIAVLDSMSKDIKK